LPRSKLARNAKRLPRCGEKDAIEARIFQPSPWHEVAGNVTLIPSPPMKLHRSLLALTLVSIVGPILAADVLANWKEHCAKCHGDDGKGDTKMGRKLSIADLTDPAVQAKFTDEDALKAMKEGVNDKAGKVAMKPIENLAADEMPALVKFVRGLKK
jgi:cytochrome c553